MYAHFDKNSGEKQLLETHLLQVATKMTTNIAPLNFTVIDKQDLEKLLYKTGCYHDLGKSKKAFQNYLITGKGGHEKDHALISAVIFLLSYQKNNIVSKEDLLKKKLKQLPDNKICNYISFLAITYHHGEIKNQVEKEGQSFASLPTQYEECFNALSKSPLNCCEMIYKTLDMEYINAYMCVQIILTMKKYCKSEWFFLLQYIFSKLIWADKLDSANLHTDKQIIIKTVADVDKYILQKQNNFSLAKNQITKNNEVCLTKSKLSPSYLNSQKDNKIALNDKRTEIKNKVINKIRNLSDEEIKKDKIYTITAPTGTGKTLTSICAALEFQKRIYELEGYIPKIITALPYINILEQTKQDYEAIFDDVFVHHSLNEYETEDKSENIPLKDRYLLTNAWENDVIITTFVQFFESILTSKNSKLIKLNKLAGSIVILDEIQSLPAEYYPLIGAIIKHISDYYGTRFILMTATQPEIVSYANRLLENNKMSAMELLEDSKKYYKDLKRTRLECKLDTVNDNEAVVRLIKETKKESDAALVVVNTISQSIDLYKLLKDDYETLYLSTNLISEDRKLVIQKAKDYLLEKKPFILVSTQTIEAGVDLDFDIGYRDLAPMESIIQVAGRVNRSGKKGEYSPVYIFNTDSSKKVYKYYHLSKTKELLNNKIYETEYQEIIQEYYKILLEDESHETEIYKAIKKLDYDIINTFHLIEDNRKISVIIEKDDKIAKYLEEIKEMLKEKKDFEQKMKIRNQMNKISRYMVDVDESKLKNHHPWELKDTHDIYMNLLIVPKENVEDYYDETGYIFENKGAEFF